MPEARGISPGRLRAERGSLLVLLAGVLAVTALAQWLRPYAFLWDDNASFFLPAYVHNWRTLIEHGGLAHVNQHQYLGQIWLGNGQSGVLYPPTYAAAAAAQGLWGDLRPTVDVLAFGHWLIAAVGMFVLLRTWRVGRSIAVLASLLWVTFPFLQQVTRNWIFVAYAAAWLPWNVLVLDRLRRAPGLGAIVALATIKALFFYQGYIQYAVLTAMADGLYLAVFALVGSDARRFRLRVLARTAGGYLAALGLGAGLAAPLLFPMWQVKQLSAYRATRLSFAEFVSNALPFDAFAWAQVGVMQPNAVHRATGAIFFVGLPVLALLVLLARPTIRRVAPQTLPVLATAVGMLILASPAWGWLYRVPVVNSFRWPFKTFLLFLAFATMAAALAAQGLAARGRNGRRLALGALLAGLAGNLGVLAIGDWNRTFGPYRVDASVAELSSSVRASLAGDGRVVSMWQQHDQTSMPSHVTLGFASLMGVDHIGGYDPLIADENLRLALRLEYSNIFRYELDQRLLTHLSQWGVRSFVVPARPFADEALAGWPTLQRRFADGERAVWENTGAWPLVGFGDGPAGGVPYRTTANGLIAHTEGRGGRLRIALAPLPWWFWSADGIDQGAVDSDARRQMSLDVPAGTESVEVRYVDVPMRLGSALASALLASLVGVAWLRRRRLRARG